MPDYRKLAKRLIAAAGLAAVVLGPTALNTPAAGADPIPQRGVGTTRAAALTIEPLQVRAGGTQATVELRASAPVAISHTVRRVTEGSGGTPIPPSRRPEVANPFGGGVISTGGTQPSAVYKDGYSIHLAGLQSNTTYEVIVNAATMTGESAVARATFKTLPARVRVILEEINVEDDGDSIFRGDGDPRWEMDLTLGGKLCYPIKCGSFGNFGEGRFVPRDPAGNRLTWQLFEEVFNGLPDTLTISVKAEEDDGAISGSPSQISTATAEWRVPRGVESASSRIQVRGDQASRGFRSVLTFTFELFHDDTPYVIN